MLHTSKSVYITIFNNPVTPFPHNSFKQIFQDPAHTFSSGKTLAMKTTIWITSPKVYLATGGSGEASGPAKPSKMAAWCMAREVMT